LPFRDAETHVRDIIESIDYIDEFVGSMDFAAYQDDEKTKSAVERKLQILTEAAKRLGEKDGAKFMGSQWLDYCNMGNVIRHKYHRVDDMIVWNTIKIDLPALKAALRKALSSPKP
jgi:uncharacterized protein with HEPN domain